MKQYIFIITLIIVIVVWILVYIQSRKAIEPFTALPTRECKVWFTDDLKSCNDGLYHKDLRSLQYLRDNLVGNMEKQLASEKQKMAANTAIISQYKGMSERAIRDKIFATSSAIVANEQAKLSNRNQGLIDEHQNYLNRIDYYARYYYTIITTLEAENARFANSITVLENKIKMAKNTNQYSLIVKALEAKKSNPNFICKNEYSGWVEPNSGSDTINNDPAKKVSSTTADRRGDPYTWATCYKLHESTNEKSNMHSYIENNKTKYNDIEYDNRKVDSLTEEQNNRTSQIRFNRFNQGDLTVCDDRVVNPQMPSIPNGLLEIKVNSDDIIQSIKQIKYTDDSRFISQSTNIGAIDGNKLNSIFYDVIYEAWPTQQLYLYAKRGADIVYRVHYVYYDNKCQRFYKSSDIPLGVSKGGDLLVNDPPLIINNNTSFQDIFSRSIKNKSIPTRFYINTQNVSGLALFSNIQKGFEKDIDNMNKLITKTRNELNWYVRLRDWWATLYHRTPATYTRCRWRIVRVGRSLQWRRVCVTYTNWKKNYYLVLLQRYQKPVTRLENLLNKDYIPKLNGLISRSNSFNSYLKELDTILNTFNKNIIQSRLQSYVGKPAAEFMKSYNPSYISNNNTLYLQVSSYSKATKSINYLDDTAARISTPSQPVTVFDILDEDTTYESVFTAEEVDPDNFLYIPEVDYTAMLSELEKELLTNYVMFYNKNNEEIYTVSDYGTFTLYDETSDTSDDINSPEDPVYYIDMAPNTRVQIVNGAGVTTTYDNSSDATSRKKVELNSSMTGANNCSGVTDEANEKYRKCIDNLMVKITVSKYA